MVCKNNSDLQNTRLDINFRSRSLYYRRYSIWQIGPRPMATVGSNIFKVRHYVFPIEMRLCASLWNMALRGRLVIMKFVKKMKVNDARLTLHSVCVNSTFRLNLTPVEKENKTKRWPLFFSTFFYYFLSIYILIIVFTHI